MRLTCRLVAAMLTAIGFPVIAAADLLFDGSEFPVNTYTTGDQYGRLARSVARAPDGGFVVVWTSSAYPRGSSYEQDGSGASVHGQRYDSEGAAVGTEFQVNSHTLGNQHGPAISMAADGSFVIVWMSYGQDGDRVGVFGKRYDGAGAAVGSEFQVNTYTTGYQEEPAVAVSHDGSFVVVWSSHGHPRPKQDGDQSGVFGQRYDSAGAAVGSEFPVNSYTTYSQFGPSVSVAADGSFVVAWVSGGWDYKVDNPASPDGNLAGVYGQRFDSSGGKAGSEFRINSYTIGSQRNPTVSVAPDGGFTVAWESAGQDGSDSGVFRKRYDNRGAVFGGEFRVNSYTSGRQRNPAVSISADGGFLVVWESNGQDGSDDGVFGQRYDGAGVPVGDEFQINSHTTHFQSSASVAADDDGNFVVVWRSAAHQDGDAIGVFGQLICVDDNENAICDGRESARACGDTADSEGITTTDVLFVLRAVVGLSACLPCVGDVDGSGSIAVSDALRLLFASVGQDVELLCPPCV